MGGGYWLTVTRTFEAINASPGPCWDGWGQSSLVVWLSKWAGNLAGRWSRDPWNGTFPRGGRLMGNVIFGAPAWLSRLGGLGRG